MSHISVIILPWLFSSKHYSLRYFGGITGEYIYTNELLFEISEINSYNMSYDPLLIYNNML